MSGDEQSEVQGIAIIGIACRFPGAEDVDEYWKLLCEGKESITKFTKEELLAAGIDPDLVNNPAYVGARGLIEKPECFDAGFFGISPNEAKLMDPQQRVFLESCWHALESAGYAPTKLEIPVGLWGGMSTGMTNNIYSIENIYSDKQNLPKEDQVSAMLGSSSGYLTTRVSYKLNLKGPSVNVQSACSTSLVAVAEAFNSLMTYGCDMALAGGVSVSYPQVEGYLTQEGDIGAPDGHCRPFDKEANGTVFSNGVGVVVLKRLEDAIEDNDNIFAVIRGAALNNDGSNKVSFAAPSVDGQAEVIATAQAIAEIDPQTISFVETHGTATPLGDPVEVAGLTKAFGEENIKPNSCALGSVKSNFGHLEAAAGIASLIKAALCLYHKSLVPTLHFKSPNPNIDFSNTPFYINTDTKDWIANNSPLRAGVSGFGIGGTNAHLVLEESPLPHGISTPVEKDAAHLLLISGKSDKAVKETAEGIANYLAVHPETSLSDVAFTLKNGRDVFAYRYACVAADLEEAVANLSTKGIKLGNLKKRLQGELEPVFMFPGGGAQYVDMGVSLYNNDKRFRDEIDNSIELLKNKHAIDLKPIWFAVSDIEKAQELFKKPSLQLPALFILEVALANWLMNLGIKPSALVGHSMGENTAACIAGVMSYQDALGLVVLRGKLFEQVEEGGMLSIALSSEAIKPYLGSSLDLATVNGVEQCTVTGKQEDISDLYDKLQSEAVDAQIVPIKVAAHSRLLEPILEPFKEYLESIELREAQIPIQSNYSGQWLTKDQATSASYWVSHLRNTVWFEKNIQSLAKEKNRVYIEVGPGKVLSSLARLSRPDQASQVVVTLGHKNDQSRELFSLIENVVNVWSLGLDLDLDKLPITSTGRKVHLPGYAFQRKPFYIEPKKQDKASVNVQVESISNANPTKTTKTTNFVVPVMDRKELVLNKLRDIVHDMSGLEYDQMDNESSFIDMGFDSLFLTQVNLRFKKEFKVKITFKQLFGEAPDLLSLASYIDKQLPEDAYKEQLTQTASPQPPAPITAQEYGQLTTVENSLSNASGSTLESALALQVQASNALLNYIKTGINPPAPSNVVAASESPNKIELDVDCFEKQPPTHGRIGPYKPLDKSLQGELTEAQTTYLKAFLKKYEAKTKNSKTLTEEHREHFADPRAVGGFKTAWKEICYPIAAETSKGARLKDVDGNDYIDCVGGFGAGFFGQGPDFMLDAVRKQMDISVDYGPQSLNAGRLAKKICDFTGFDRASFCNTGSEAVLAAMRVARTVTGNDLIATFSGDYHGIFDEVLVKAQVVGKKRKNLAIAPGIPESSNQNMLVLEYGDPGSLDVIKEYASELAGVLVEPIQSRMPELQPVEFVQQLRALTKELDVPLIFDEIITGFRLHNKGAQAWFGVDVDIAAYGKVIGAGMPIGVVAGKSKYLDALDGGMWNYGDDSFPEAGVTYFAGTFVRHPLALAAVEAVLTKLESEGPAIQQEASCRAAKFCERVNRQYHKQGIPIELVYFGTVILPRYRGNPDFEGLYFYHLRYYGAHIWEGRPGFLTTEHKEQELQELEQAFIKAGNAMFDAGFFADVETNKIITYPWTPAQQEVWMTFKLHPNASSSYNEQVMFDIDNDIDVEALELALDKTANHHPSLRAVVNEFETGLEVHPYVSPTLEFIDLSQLDEHKREKELIAKAKQHLNKPFDFVNGSLIRALLVKTEPGKHKLCVCTSHIVCDGLSLEVVMLDFASYYTAMINGRYPVVSKNDQINEFINLRHDSTVSEEWADARDYWLNVYKSIPKPIALPEDNIRPRVRDFVGERHSTYIGNEVMEPIRQLAKDQGCTSFVVMLAAFEILMHRLSGQNDLVIGVPVAGQPQLGMSDFVCHDVSFLPFRFLVDGNFTFSELLEKLRDEFLEAKTNQDFAFGDLLQALKLPRDPGRLPLVTAAFNLDMAYSPLDFGGVIGRFRSSPRGVVKYDLNVNLTDEGDRVLFEVDRYAAIFDAETVNRWMMQFEAILKEIVDDPSRPVHEITGELDSLSDIVDSINNTQQRFENTPLVELLHKQASINPDAVAIQEGRKACSYKESSYKECSYNAFDERTNKLARLLNAKGYGKGDCIAICGFAGIDWLTAMWAVIKSGAAYVPLDAAYPTERLNLMVLESKAKLLLSEDSLLDRFTAFDGEKIPFKHLDVLLTDIPSTKLENEVAGQDPLYVVFTSGSTGIPKGAVVTHSNELNLQYWYQQEYQFDNNNRTSVFSALGFDLTQKNLIAPLISGGRVVFTGERDYNPAAIIETINDAQVTTFNCAPSALYPLLQNSENYPKLSSLKWVLLGGESIQVDKLKTWLADAHTDAKVVNMYGPTECTDIATTFCLPPSDQASGKVVPIGKPIANVQVYVLNQQGRKVAVGDVGELHIGGAGVGVGYLNDSAKTKESFIKNPFGEGNLYRTGDLVILKSSGNIEYVSRVDSQIKIRGYRVDLGDIESRINKIHGLQDSVVALIEEEIGSPKLVAFCVLKPGFGLPGTSEIRGELKKSLPEYMIPSAFGVIDEIPLSPNGKVNRAALPSIDVEMIVAGDLIQPKTSTEKALAKLWQEILGQDKIDACHDFFELGGHSLLGIQMLARVNTELGVSLGLHVLFESPTIQDLAKEIDLALSPSEARRLHLEIDKRTSQENPPASSQQTRLWYLEQLEPGYNAHNNSAVFKLLGALNTKALQQAIDTIVSRHEGIRSNIVLKDGAVVQQIKPSIPADLTPITLEAMGVSKEEELWDRFRTLASEPMDLASDPLFKVRLIKTNEDEHVLWLLIHHVIFDGWSYDVLIHELVALYNAYNAEKPNPLPELPVQYGDYAIWQQGFLNSDLIKEQLGYWKQKLSGELPVLDLVADKKRPALQPHASDSLQFKLPQDTVSKIEKMAAQQGCTVYMAMLAMYVVVLHRYSQQNDIIVGSPISGRNIAETNDLLGFFINTLMLRFDIKSNLSFNDWLKEVKTICTEAYNYQDTPFELLVRELNPPRDLSRSPIYQTLFIYQDVRNRTDEFDGLVKQQVNVDRAGVQTDLDVWLKRESDGILAGIEYPVALFNRQTIERFANCFQALAGAIVTNPFLTVAHLAAADESEQQKINTWNNQTRYEFSQLTLLQTIKQHAQFKGDVLAVVCDDVQINYRELHSKSNQLAHYLIEKRVQPNDMVAICMDRSVEMLVALLAVWKAGACYVPVDPEFPASRISYMLEASNAPVLLTHTPYERLSKAFRGSILNIDAHESAISTSSAADTGLFFNPTGIAYVIFTSGSTGKPKGVQVPHDSVNNFLYSMSEKPGMTAEDTLLAVTTLSFDIAVLELYLPLLVGAKVVIATKQQAGAGIELLELIQKHKINLLQATPSTWRLLLAAGWQGDVDFKALCGGEALPQDLAVALIDRTKSTWNMYGPTETTVWSTCHELLSPEKILIGSPIANTRCYVLDHEGKQLPVGVPGELYIGGKGVAAGYLGREDLTQERFIVDPFSDHVGALMYRTGDLVRWLDSGDLEYLQRIDNQVKLRGFRIELGEIESALLGFKGIKQAVANVFKVSEVDQRLVGYYVLEEGVETTNTELRIFLKETLPDYMVPQLFVPLSRMPLTPNGKIDRNALPEPLQTAGGGKAYQVPETETEVLIAEIWQEALKIEKISKNDQFFEVGGHSLLAIEVIYKIDQRLNYKLSHRDMLDHTLAQIASIIANAQENDPVNIPKSGVQSYVDEALPLSDKKSGRWKRWMSKIKS